MFLKNDQGQDVENLGRLEVTHLRNNDEFKSIVGQLQVDFGGKLEIKMTDMVNRLLMEQEERQR